MRTGLSKHQGHNRRQAMLAAGQRGHFAAALDPQVECKGCHARFPLSAAVLKAGKPACPHC